MPPRQVTNISRTARKNAPVDQITEKLSKISLQDSSTPSNRPSRFVKTTAASTSKSKLAPSAKENLPKPSETKKENGIAGAKNALDVSSHSMADIVESGWKASQSSKVGTKQSSTKSQQKHTLVDVLNVVEAYQAALSELRQFVDSVASFEKRIELERTATNFVGKMISIELYLPALHFLQNIAPRLKATFVPASPAISAPTSSPSLFKLSSLTLSKEHLALLEFSSLQGIEPWDPTFSALMASHYLHALTAIVNSLDENSIKLLAEVLSSASPSFPHLSKNLNFPSKQQTQFHLSLFNVIGRSKLAIFTNPPTPLHAISVYQVRSYGLLCLVEADELDGELFWDQTCRWAATLAKVTVDTEDEESARKELLKCFRCLVERAQHRKASSNFMNGKAFITFCELWITSARKMQDTTHIQAISQALGSAGPLDVSDATSHGVQAARLCVQLAGISIALDNYQAEGKSSAAQPGLDQAISHIRSCTTFCASYPRELRGALHVALDKLRRQCILLVQDDNCPLRDASVACLNAIVQHIEQLSLLDHGEKIDLWRMLVKASIETLWTLANSVSHDSKRGNNEAFGYLERCLPLAHSLLPISSSSVEGEVAAILRDISAWYYNIGTSVFKSLRGGPIEAMRFFRTSAELGAKALVLYGEQTDTAEAWKTLGEQIPRRWELCGVCSVKTSDKEMALDCFIQAILQVPTPTYTALALQSSSTPMSALFEASRCTDLGLRSLVSTLDRLVSLYSSDFLRARQFRSVASYVNGASSKSQNGLYESLNLGNDVTGALLEYILLLLEETLQMDEARPFFTLIMDELDRVYGSDTYPVRRARVLIKRLEFSYGSGEGYSVEMEAEVLALLHRKEWGNDSLLHRFIPQYLASAHIWLAFLLHIPRESGVEENGRTNAIIQHLTEALSTIQQSVLMELAHAPPAKSTPGNISTNSRKLQAKTASPRTPKNNDRDLPLRAPRVTATVSLANNAGEILIDNYDAFYKLLEMTAQFLSVLGHIVLKLECLHILRELYKKFPTLTSFDAYVRISIQLAQEFCRLKKVESGRTIYGSLLEEARGSAVTLSNEVRIQLYLRYAEALAATGKTDESLSLYGKALKLSDATPTEKHQSPVLRVRAKASTMERSAIAALAFSTVQDSRDNSVAVVSGQLQSLRLWTRAADNLSRIYQPTNTKAAPQSPNPFEVSQKPLVDDETTKRTQRKQLLDTMQWRVAEGLLNTIFALCRSYFARGSVRESQSMAKMALELAQSMNLPGMFSRARAWQGELELSMAHMDKVVTLLLEASSITVLLTGADTANVHRLQGDFSRRNENPEEAKVMYKNATSALDLLQRHISKFDAGHARVFSPGSDSAQEVVEPALLAAVLHQQIWLLRDDEASESEYDQLLERFLSLPSSSETKIKENALMGKLTLSDVHSRLAADIFLSSLPDSSIALPMGMSGGDVGLSPSSTREIIKVLSSAEKYFSTSLELASDRGEVTHVRDAAISLSIIRTFQSSLGKNSKNGPTVVAALLNIALTPTLGREMIECADRKFLDTATFEDLVWPAMSLTGTPVAPSRERSRRAIMFDAETSEDEEESPNKSLKDYWRGVRDRYRFESVDLASLATSQVDQLPTNWTFISITVTEDRNTMILSRQRSHREPLVFCLPLDRQGRRDGNDEHFTFIDAIQELDSIIRDSNSTALGAKNVKGHDQKVQWWETRRALDKRLGELLSNIEFCWLGVFKTILGAPAHCTPAELSSLRARLEKVFTRNGVKKDKKQASKARLDDNILECFSTLSAQCRDEELEDLAYFILDLYQLNGVQVALAEIDVTQVAVDLRSVFEELSTDRQSREDDHHIFLAVDKNLQSIPWESIPILRGRPVSRIPSMSFLLDRIELCRHPLPGRPQPSNDRTFVDPRKTFFVMNPEGDLRHTETELGPWLNEMKSAGWNGISNRAPSQEELIKGLTTNDLVLYFGHGGAEQYIRSHKIRHLPRCAATMLWGCSSGLLRDMGDFDRVGTPYDYMLAGCPTLVANLWDVTDRDIDKLSASVFKKLRLDPEHVRAWTPSEVDGEAKISVVAAVAQSRESCKLKYLTGAAPVVYGIPFYL